MRYADIVTVAPRFSRAVSLERDANVPSSIEGYVITSTAEDIVARLGRALSSPTGHRAWTLTGPYGSGKSAFALYLANLLASAQNPGGQLARSILKAQREPLFQDLFDRRRKGAIAANGFCPVLISGSAEPIALALLRACCRDIGRYYKRGRPPKAFHELQKLRSRAERNKSFPASVLVRAITEIALSLQQTGRSNGILLVIDELGKFLEFAARVPEQGDIHLLQQLAEATAQFSPPGLYLLTILHQSFERYAVGLRPAIRNEWSKVQGRFEDIAFQEPPDQFLEILAQAIKRSAHPATPQIERTAARYAEIAFGLGLAPLGMGKQQFVQALRRAAPLHPLSALLLARMCRKLGQHQRSLFAFLVSREPHAFSGFLDREVAKNQLPFYRVPELYDYVDSAIGNGLSVGDSASRWAEVQGALDRSADATRDELEVVKTVGMLTAVGSFGQLKPSDSVIEFALGATNSSLRQTTKNLVSRSVLVYRKHSQSFAFWQGSDIDVEFQIAEAKKRVHPSASLAKQLTNLWHPRPLVAKRHSFQTGTLRYFSLRFADPSVFSKSLEPHSDADGIIIYCLPSSQSEVEQLTDLATQSPVRERPEILVAVPRDAAALREAVRELELLRWVEVNTPELKGDLVARREVRARIGASERNVAHEIESLFSPTRIPNSSTAWFHRGVPVRIFDGRSLSQLLSDICDAVYVHTPRLRNELLNRRSLSSAAAAARRNLIEAMMTRGSEAQLGLTGTPPEMSMYASALRSTGIHYLAESGYSFGPPRNDPHLTQVWNALKHFFSTCELNRRPVGEIFSELQKPPYGLKMGVIPVLFCASIIAHDTELAFYENGGFIPELTVDNFERLLSSSDGFELRRYRIVGIRREVFRHFAKLVGTKVEEKERHLVAIVRPLYRFLNQLPAYTKNTGSISEVTLAVRKALLNAKEPDALLFEDLPTACNARPFPAANADPKEVASFFRTLKSSFGELQRCYDDLLADLGRLLFSAFHVKDAKAREMLRARSQTMADRTLEPRLQAFLNHLSDDQLGDAAWIEAIATLLTGRAPQTWSDTDRARYEIGLSECTRAFRHVEALTFESVSRERSGRASSEVLRIGVTDQYSKDREAVVAVDSTDKNLLARAVIDIEGCLENLQMSSNAELSLAALATVARRFLSELEDTKLIKEQPRSVGVGRG